MRARDNPFSTDRVLRIRYRLRGESWSSLIERLAAMQYRGAIVGPEGAGKTTLLEDLEPHLRERGFEILHLRLTRDQPRFLRRTINELHTQLSCRHIILFDGAEQFSRWSWWWFRRCVRRAAGLIVTSHRPGLLRTLIECRTDETLFDGIIADLLHEPVDLQREISASLFRKYNGNLRDALRELYDDWAERATDPAECRLPAADRSRDRTAACPLAG